ncbi:SFRP5 protein, partial [Leiothrix lutea]|nr:SFRP5 protein [Leiothrix lutea]
AGSGRRAAAMPQAGSHPWSRGTALLALSLALAGSLGGGQHYDYYGWQPESLPHGRFYGREPQCLDIPPDMQLCRDVGYKRMRLPNLLEHETMAEAKQQAGSWVPLLANFRLGPALLLLCHPLMRRCPHISSPPGDDPGQQGALCLPALPHHSSLRSRGVAGVLPSVSLRNWPSNWSLTAVSKICTQCEMEHKADGMMEQMCSSDFVVKMRIKEMTEENGERRLVAAQKKKVLKLGPLKRKDTKKMVLHMRNAGACPCPQLDSLSGSFLVMGRKVGGRLLLLAIYPWQKHNKEMKFAVKFMFSYPCPLYHPLLYGAGQH